MKKEYQSYEEYLEDAYEEWCDLFEEQRKNEMRSAYGSPSNRLTIKEYNGEMIAEWNREKNQQTE